MSEINKYYQVCATSSSAYIDIVNKLETEYYDQLDVPISFNGEEFIPHREVDHPHKKIHSPTRSVFLLSNIGGTTNENPFFIKKSTPYLCIA